MTHKEILEQTKSELDRLVSEAKRKLDNLIKPELKIGKWYYIEPSPLYIDKPKMNALVFNNGEHYSYGFSYKGNFIDSFNIGNCIDQVLKEATDQEVEDALIKEAEKRYKLGVIIQSMIEERYTWEIKSKPKFGLYNGRLLLTSSLVCEKGEFRQQGSIEVFKDGKWAEVIKNDGKFAELKEEWYDWLPNFDRIRIKPEEEEKT